jgi:hypothetical protein
MTFSIGLAALIGLSEWLVATELFWLALPANWPKLARFFTSPEGHLPGLLFMLAVVGLGSAYFTGRGQDWSSKMVFYLTLPVGVASLAVFLVWMTASNLWWLLFPLPWPPLVRLAAHKEGHLPVFFLVLGGLALVTALGTGEMGNAIRKLARAMRR